MSRKEVPVPEDTQTESLETVLDAGDSDGGGEASSDPDVEKPAEMDAADLGEEYQKELEFEAIPETEDELGGESDRVLDAFVAEDFDLVSAEFPLEAFDADGEESIAGPEETEASEIKQPAEVPEPAPVEERQSQEITPAKLASSLGRLKRTLAYAVEDEGERLWSLPYLERTCMPIVDKLLDCILPTAVGESLLMVRNALVGLDEKRWDERLEPLLKACRQVDLALDAAPTGTDVELVPMVRLVDPAGIAEVAPEGDGGGRRRRRRRRGRNRTRNQEAPHEERVSPPPVSRPQYLLGVEEHTGASIRTLAGVDEETGAALEAAGVGTIEDLLLRSPEAHDKVEIWNGESVSDDGPLVAVQATVLAQWLAFSRGERQTRARLDCGEKVIECVWTRSGESCVRDGEEVLLVGALKHENEAFALMDGVRWKADSRGVVRVARYGVEGVDEGVYVGLVRQALESYLPEIIDPIPEKTLRLGRVQNLRQALEELHIPTGGLSFGASRLVFGELFLQQLRAALKEKVRYKGIKHVLGHERIAQLNVQFDLILGDSQERAFDEIRRDLRRPYAMTRLLQGDVGSGKALVALLSAVLVAEGKSQVLFLAPNGLAAEHRALFAEPLLRSVGLVSQLVPSTPSNAQVDAIRRGETDIVFGTHALLESKLPEFKRLGLVVVEQRSSFGVVDREKLQQGKSQPDLLVVTSVPIPSSLAFTLFADHEISLIEREVEGVVDSRVLTPDEREEGYAHIRQIIEEGKQAYVVFPLRNGVDILDRDRGTLLISAMGQEAFPGARVALFHGSMTREERYRVFEDFKCRRIDVLLAMTEIEDAPEIPNAAVVMVENADHFDLVRLHRIRGHVSCGNAAGACYYILSAEPSKEGAEVVEMIAAEQDGFAIAEEDRMLRGDQALLGEQAADLPPMRWANPTRDRKMLLRARRSAFDLLAEDPKLRSRANRGIARFLFPDGLPEGEREGESSPNESTGRNRRPRRRRRGGGRGKES